MSETAMFPANIVNNIYEAVARLSTILEEAITDSDTFIKAKTDGFPPKGFIVIDNETIEYDSKTVTGFNITTGRGYAGTATAHEEDAPIRYAITAAIINRIIAEIVAIETELGVNCENILKKSDELSTIITTIASSATPTPARVSVRTVLIITALAEPAQLQNPTGTLKNMDLFWVKIKDNGTAQAITYDTKYADKSGMGLPDITVANKELNMLFVYNETADTLDMISMAQEA